MQFVGEPGVVYVASLLSRFKYVSQLLRIKPKVQRFHGRLKFVKRKLPSVSGVHGRKRATDVLQSVGKQLAGGFRLLTDGVCDATDTASEHKYGVIAYCTFETSPAFTFPPPPRGTQSIIALAVVSKVAAPQNPEHKADLFIEAMEKIETADTDAIVRTLKHMQRHGRAPQATDDEAVASSPPWQQRKCRRMGRYPTIV